MRTKIKYDLFKHGEGVKVWNNQTKKTGTVVRIREFAADCIEPLVDYGDGKLVAEITWRLEYIDEASMDNPKG